MAELRPDCRALVVAVEGLRPGPCETYSEELLSRAEATAADPEEHPHIAARLVRAEGTEPFEASAGGDPAAAPPFTGRCRVRPVNDRRGSRPPVRRELSGQQVELPTLTERTERVMSDAFLPAPTVATGEPAHPVRSYSRTVDDSRL